MRFQNLGCLHETINEVTFNSLEKVKFPQAQCTVVNLLQIHFYFGFLKIDHFLIAISLFTKD